MAMLWIGVAQAQESVDEDIDIPPPAEQPAAPQNAPADTALPTVNTPEDTDNPLKKEEAHVATGVKLRALNKVTARSSPIEGALNAPLEFGDLTIVAKACLVAPAAERPEQSALLEITEKNPDMGNHVIFSGWMFASSPALSALESPVYDITLLSCKE